MFIVDTSLDPFFNLAAEEYLLSSISEPVVRLWRNDACIVIGRNQNALAEIDSEYVAQQGIKVVRRLSGGGAVFHDPGNVNFTFIDNNSGLESTSDMFRRFTAPIIEALRNLGVDACLQGRNDLTIDGLKFSGNAICVQGGRILQHGTLLFDSRMANLARALRSKPEKFIGKAVKSNVSRVTNILEHLPVKMSVEEFIQYLADFLSKGEKPYAYTHADIEAIKALASSKYASDSWNYGKTARYSFGNQCRFPSGIINISFEVADGKISEMAVEGDYFFTLPTENFCREMVGCYHNRSAIAARLASLPINEYFAGLSADDILQLFF
ncbi:MAG: lipoate--protein ligase [Bacteroidales bacterium]|nr:lipoate--protein ligase [Bacteroidales bacterium]